VEVGVTEQRRLEIPCGEMMQGQQKQIVWRGGGRKKEVKFKSIKYKFNTKARF
jgi:hypothetical protein